MFRFHLEFKDLMCVGGHNYLPTNFQDFVARARRDLLGVMRLKGTLTPSFIASIIAKVFVNANQDRFTQFRQD